MGFLKDSSSTNRKDRNNNCYCPGCQRPLPVEVDLTHYYYYYVDGGNGDTTNHSLFQQQQQQQQQQQLELVRNLQTWGWSPLRIRLADDNEKNDDGLLSQHGQWKSLIQELFDNEMVVQEAKLNRNVQWFAAESGAAGTAAVEPKQSWEFQRRRNDNTTTTTYCKVQDRMQTWTRFLHQVAVCVTRCLELPANTTLLSETDDTTNDDRSVDLLRAFYYDTADNSNSLGSSTHTDWGSWTVIWQDDVQGCLQTTCPVCQEWVDVPTALPQQSSISLIIHVGDMTSIAIKQAINNKNNSFWPSPKHRVLSPVSEKRCSLVYFCYPPANLSLSDMVTKLKEQQSSPENNNDQTTRPVWTTDTTTTTTVEESSSQSQSQQSSSRIPYQDYYLLKNQSSSHNDNYDQKDEEEQLKTIYKQPVSTVLQQKWNQVQRT